MSWSNVGLLWFLASSQESQYWVVGDLGSHVVLLPCATDEKSRVSDIGIDRGPLSFIAVPGGGVPRVISGPGKMFSTLDLGSQVFFLVL